MAIGESRNNKKRPTLLWQSSEVDEAMAGQTVTYSLNSVGSVGFTVPHQKLPFAIAVLICGSLPRIEAIGHDRCLSGG